MTLRKESTKSALRVVLITENFLPKIDGVTRCLARLLEHLREEGHEVMILGPGVNMSTYENYPIIGTAGIPLMLYPGLKLNFLRPKFLRSIRDFKPDVIHVVDPIWLGPQVLYALRRGWCGSKWTTSNAPIVASFHTNLPTRGSYASLFGLKFLEPIMWRWIRHIHAQCRLTACPTLSTATVLMHQGLHNMRIWPRGVDLDAFGPHKRCLELRREWGIKGSPGRCDLSTNKRGYLLTPPPSPTPSKGSHAYWNDLCVILYAGRLSYEKNLRFLIDSYSLLLEMLGELTPTPLFVFAGDGPARDSLEELCRLKRIRARFTGHLSGEQLAKCYASADVFAFPSYTETFGQVVLEALASGLPIVGLDADGTRDLVQHERTGLLLQYRPNCLNSSLIQWNEHFLPGADRYQTLSRQYAALLHRLVCNMTLRSVMGERASSSTPVGRLWGDAMECMVDCYREVAVFDNTKAVDVYESWISFRWVVICALVIVFCTMFLTCLFRAL
ncbi:group 1 family glycosyltransferase [Rhizoctonia solani 123E]|uniref:Group 1 family glycosyltransferase n=1 Tax=Rhizoctonia solani 123E TaxID=1423351 RepID=A0A074RZY7_9AGAM|nr:group 1 family glycosyltransferase [Rhizoctonia solani 123E]